MAKQGKLVFSKAMWLCRARKDATGVLQYEYAGMLTVESGHRDVNKERHDPDHFYWYSKHEPPSPELHVEWRMIVARREADELYQKQEDEREAERQAELRREQELFATLDNFMNNLI